MANQNSDDARVLALEAEVAHWKRARQAAIEGGDLLKADVERLREALEDIIGTVSGNPMSSNLWQVLGDVAKKARAALAGKEG